MIKCHSKIRQLLTLTTAFLSLQALGQANRTSDPFKPFLFHTPAVIRTLSTDTIQRPGQKAPVLVQNLIFTSRNGQNQVYAILAKPLASLQQKRTLPALLCLHGGGSKAEDLRSMVLSYAANGYVALATDLPGICNSVKAIHSSGPWKDRAQGESPRFAIEKGIGNSTLVDGAVAGLEAFNLLKSQAQVDTTRIGITGFSWGGYSTTFLSGLLGDRVKAAYAVFGCGFYDKGSFWKTIIQKMSPKLRSLWLTYLDAGRRAKNIRAAYFIESATNDTYFWPEAVSSTLDQIKSTHNHVWNPNLNHRQGPDGPLMQSLYFGYYLKNQGQPFGKVKITKIHKAKKGGKIVRAAIKLPASVSADSVCLYYSLQNADWQHRHWTRLPMQQKTGTGQYSIALPVSLTSQKINFYVRLKDNRKVVVSSQMY